MARANNLRALAAAIAVVLTVCTLMLFIGAQPSEAASSTVSDIANPDAYSCPDPTLGFLDFEDLPDGTNLSSGALNGVQFTTTGGYTWLVGDFATGGYNGKYPNGGYTSKGTHWAWLGPDQGTGRIDFVNGKASEFSLLASVNLSAVSLEAYDENDNLLATAGPTSLNYNTGHMDELRITRDTADIAYVIVHDTGNFFLIDAICTDAPGVGNQPPTADAGGPYTVDEGSSIELDGSLSSDPESGALTYAWDLDNDGQFDDSADVNPSFSADDGPSSHTVRVQVTDPEGATATDEATVNVLNAPPTIQNIAASVSQTLTGKSVLFDATTTDPSTADTNAGFTYQWLIDGNADPFTGNPLSASFSDCGDHSVSATATDKDGGVSVSVTSDVVSVQEAHFRPPLDEGVFNTVQKGRVVPVKISIGCAGQNLTGLQPAIQLLKGDKSDGSETGSDAIETFSSSAADTTGFMRAVDDGYIYNLQVPTNAVANDLYTVRVRPFGDDNPNSSMYVVLKIRK